jgi:uncharacterized membrane protein
VADSTPSLRSRYQGVRPRNIRLARLREHLAGGLWFIPALSTAVAVVTAAAVLAIDRSLGDTHQSPLAFSAGPNAAQLVLATIAASMLTFTGLVFSITIVALQLASSQFSPRVLRAFLRDRGSKIALGGFVATFVYAFIVLGAVREGGPDSAPFVPGDAISLSFVQVFATVVAFLYYVNHIAQSIRVVNIIESVARETRAAIREVHGHDGPDPGADRPDPEGPPVATICATSPGALMAIDEDDLIAVASRHDCVLRLRPHVGDYLFRGMPVVDVYGREAPAPDEVLPHLGLGVERTMYQDVAFGFRQLVDIAEKALSPAINDPTTAVQVIDRICDLLADLARRPFPSGRLVSRRGRLRLVVPVTTWDDMVALAFSELRLFGVGSFQVARRLEAALADLLAVAPHERRPALESQRRLLDAAITRAFPDPADRELARHADEQGLGA